MERLLSNSRMRAADAYTINTLGVPSQTLMQRAGKAVAEEVLKLYKEGERVLVVCGTGNNGGDGYVCARILRESGVNVKVYAFSGNLSADCLREKKNYVGEYCSEICGDIIVDCVFGTGLSREVSGEYAAVINAINDSGAYVISADIPSGINGDNGRALGVAVKADLTVAIAEYKLGHVLGDGLDFCGATVKKDIGITAEGDFAVVYGDSDISKFYPPRRRNTHKGTYGSANVIAGSRLYTGAAALALSFALQSGCGLVKLTCCEEVKNALVSAYPQAIYLGEADLLSDAIAIGCGLGNSRQTYEKVAFLLKNYKGKLIIDADGLNSISEYGEGILKDKSCEVLITPHVKEFSRLTHLTVDEILSDPVGRADAFASEYGVTVLLKSATSVISDGSRTAINVRGSTALSKGGSGDMLAGLTCGNAARGLNLFEAAVASAYVLGVSAEISAQEKTEYCATAEDILKNLHKAVKRLTD